MKRNLVVILMSLFVLTAFGQKQSSQQIVDDQFAQHPFKKRFDEKDVVKMSMGKKLKIHTEIVQNIHSSLNDTIFYYEFDSSRFTFLHAKERVLFYSAAINSRGILLDRGIKVGITKNKFASIFGIKFLSNANEIVMVDTGELCYQYFYFKKETLYKIILSGCLD